MQIIPLARPQGQAHHPACRNIPAFLMETEMAAANVSGGPNQGGEPAAGKPNPQTAAPAKPQTRPGGGKQGKGGKKS